MELGKIISKFFASGKRGMHATKITNDPRVASKAAPRGSFVIYFSSPPVLSLLF